MQTHSPPHESEFIGMWISFRSSQAFAVSSKFVV
jgi:hypothetical protein